MTDYAEVPVPDDPPPASDDPTCLECGVPLIYGGRGRKPKWCDEHKPKRSSGSSGGRKSGDVAQATAILDGMYSGVTMALMALSPNAARDWNARIPDLQQTNAVILAGDKKLCQSICKMGQGGGRLAFAAAHIMAIAPVAIIARDDLASRRGPKVYPRKRPADPGPMPDQNSHAPFPNAGFFA